MVVVGGDRVEALDQFGFDGLIQIHQVRAAALVFVIVQIHFHTPALFREGGTAVGGFQLDAVITRRVVGSGDHHPAHGVQVSYRV